MVHHEGIGLFDLAYQIVLVVGTQRANKSDVAKDLPLRAEFVRPKICHDGLEADHIKWTRFNVQ